MKAHILVCFLAYAMWKMLAQLMRAGGLGDAPRTVLEEFARVKSGDVVLATRDPDGRPGRTLLVRCVTTPDESQRVHLSRLGLALPERLRWQEEIPPAGEPPARASNVVETFAPEQPWRPRQGTFKGATA